MGYPPDDDGVDDDRRSDATTILPSAEFNYASINGVGDDMADDARIDVDFGRRGGLTQRCFRWSDELRQTLRGRRLFTLFALVNLVNYIDRGDCEIGRCRKVDCNVGSHCMIIFILWFVSVSTPLVIPGGSEEFNVFIERELHTDRPDVFLGVLQSVFILGFSVACLVFARLARYHSAFSLMSAGLGAWCASAVMAGLARPLGSYFFLMFARLLSGIGEASFVTVVPPLIAETAPPGERGVWLALFYTAMPVGAGIGYVYGSVLATSSLGWEWAFYLEALVMAPLAVACGLVPHHDATTVPNSADYGTSSTMAEAPKHISSSPTELNSLTYRSDRCGESRAPHPRRRLHVGGGESRDQDHGGEGEGGKGEGEGRTTESGRGSGEVGLLVDSSTGTSPDVCPHVGNDERQSSNHLSSWSGIDGEMNGRFRQQNGVEEEVELEEEEVEEQTGGIGAGIYHSRYAGNKSAAAPHGDDNNHDPQQSGYEATDSNSLLFRDLLQVIDRPVFCLVVLGAAANAAVTAGMSTFGTGFVTGLELLKSETAAAATFGGVICASGLIGTPAGGYLIDRADPEGRLGDEKKLAVVMLQALWLVCGATAILVTATAQSSLVPFLGLFFVGATLLFAYTSHMNLAIMLAAPKHLRPLAIAINSVMLHALGDVPSPTIVGAVKDALAPHCAASSADDYQHLKVPKWGLTGLAEMSKHSSSMFVSNGVDAFTSAAAAEVGFAESLSEMWGRLEGVRVGVGAGLRDLEEISTAAVGGAVGEIEGGVRISDACRSERGGLHLTLFIMSAWLLWTCLFFFLAWAVQSGGIERGTAPVLWIDVHGLFSTLCARATRARRRISFLCWPKIHPWRSTSAGKDSKSWYRQGCWRLGLRAGRPRCCRVASGVGAEAGGQEEQGASLEQPLLLSGGSTSSSPTESTV